jgi:Terminase RNaseH-like domain
VTTQKPRHSAARLAADAVERRRFPRAVQKDRGTLFPQQEAVVASSARSRLMLCGRRAGKTRGIRYLALDAAERFPGETVPVCERTLTSQATKNLWDELRAFEDTYQLGIRFKDTLKICELPNRSRIELIATDTVKQCDLVRGGKFPRVIIDEAGTYRPFVLQYLIEEAATPALVDLSGDLIIAGTPGILKKGYWHDICHRPDAWEMHHWTLLDNPHLGSLAKRREELRLVRERAGWDEKHPKYLREYMGVWSAGTGQLMYAGFSPALNVIDRLPERSEWAFGLSLDFGWQDPTAWVVLAWREGDPNLYVVESSQESELTVHGIALEILKLRARYRFEWIVGDPAGTGKTILESLTRDHGIPMHSAKKTDKLIHVDAVNHDFRSGRLQLVEQTNRELIADLEILPLNDLGTDAEEGFADHLPDALLYGVREHGVAITPEGERYTRVGSEEWYAMEESRMLDEAVEGLRRNQPGYEDETPLGLDELEQMA